jgi:hypothetical protein
VFKGPATPVQFVMAVTDRWPDVVLQFEDFNLEHAEPLLQVCPTSQMLSSTFPASTCVLGMLGLRCGIGKNKLKVLHGDLPFGMEMNPTVSAWSQLHAHTVTCI